MAVDNGYFLQQQAQRAAARKAPTPTTPTPVSTPTSGPPLGASPATPGVTLTPTNPAQDLRGQTISVAPTANREQLASQYLKNYDAASEPYFQRDVRTATNNGAAKGQLNSGQLKTSLGDLTLNRDVQRNAAGSNFLTNALEGSINDAYQNVGIAQQQQQFQSGLQGQAFSQALQRYLAGTSGNPSSAEFAASNLAGENASTGGAALQAFLQQLGYGPMASPTPSTSLPTGTPIYNTGAVYG